MIQDDMCAHIDVSAYDHMSSHTRIYVSSGGSRIAYGGGGRSGRYSLYLLYWYKSTNADTEGGVAALLDAVRRHNEEGKEPAAKKPRAAKAAPKPKGRATAPGTPRERERERAYGCIREGRATAPGTLSSTH
jgi:hypothetical protein